MRKGSRCCQETHIHLLIQTGRKVKRGKDKVEREGRSVSVERDRYDNRRRWRAMCYREVKQCSEDAQELVIVFRIVSCANET